MTIKRILKLILNVNNIKIIDLEFDLLTNTFLIHVDMTKGQKSRCPICDKKCPGYDSTTKAKKWRSLDFAACKVYIIADVCRIECPEHGVHTQAVPWAYHRSNFTKEFEQQVAYLSLYLTRKDVSTIMRISWNTVGPILSRVKLRLEPDSRVRFVNLRRIGIDETSYRKGHKYITIIVDHDTRQVIWVGNKTGKDVLEKFMMELSEEQRLAIELVSADGAKWIKSCVTEWLPNAELCIDGFHVVMWANEALDECRKVFWREAMQERKNQPKSRVGRPKKGEEKRVNTTKGLKSAKYTLGKNPENLTPYQASCLDGIRNVYPKLFRAYQLKEGLRMVFQCNAETVEYELKKWLSWACRSRIPAFVELSKKIRRHYNSILATVNYGLSNARIESMNNKIKVIIRKAYGFRNIQNLIDMIMIACSNLSKQIKLPYANR